MKDGTKIVIFSAIFESHDDIPTIKLSYNAVKKAKASARLGALPAKYFERGIAVDTLIPGGITIHISRLLVLCIMDCRTTHIFDSSQNMFCWPSIRKSAC